MVWLIDWILRMTGRRGIGIGTGSSQRDVGAGTDVNEVGNPEDGFLDFTSQSADFLSVLEYRASITSIDVNGVVGANQVSFEHVAHQREALWVLRLGLEESDTAAVDLALKAFEWGFTKQKVGGNFENGLGATDLQAVGVDAFFLQAYARAYYLISRSEFAATYSARLTTLNANLGDALTWLTATASYTELYDQDKNAANRLFFDAIAFGLCGLIDSNSTAVNLAATFANYGMALQDTSGWFSENGGYDSGYQTVSLLNIGCLLGYFAGEDIAVDLLAAFKRGVAWETTRILGDGEVDTTGNSRTGPDPLKDVNYYEVILSFFYAASMLQSTSSYVATGDLISSYVVDELGL